jgi:rhomboid protease GluP
MLDDDILIGLTAFLAALSLVQFLRRRDLRASGQRGGWVAASALVLAAAGGLYLWHPPDAGLAALGVMLALLLVPNLAARAVDSLLRGGRTRSAYLACLLVALLHPSRSWWRMLRVIAALLPTLRDDTPAAVAALRRLLADESWSAAPERVLARLHLARLTADWSALAALPAGPATDAARLRGLAELGDRGAMLDQYAIALRQGAPPAALLSMTVLAFCGRAGPVARLLAGPLADMPRDAARFWLATARLAAGESAKAVPVLEDLAVHAGRVDLRAAAAWRLGWSPPHGQLDARHAAIVSEAAARAAAAPVAGAATPIVTPALIALNLAMFALEIWSGGSTDSDVLYDLGALWPDDVISGGQPWRLATALFLHAGVAHILFNMLALALFGAPLERRLGWLRFAVLYMGAGLASMLAVTLLTMRGVLAPDLLVGASGAIMGLIGGMAALLLRQPGADPRRARAGLRQMVVLIVLQSGIDAVVPHISMAGHLSGAASGFLIGMVLPLPRADRRLKRLLDMD